MAPDQSMAAAYQKGEKDRLITLNGVAQVSPGGTVELHTADGTRVFDAHARESGLWSVKYRHPLSCYQAFSIAISALHNPRTQALDQLPRGESATDAAVDAEVRGLCGEAHAVLDRGGSIKEAHDTYYKPTADQLMSEAVSAALAATPGSSEDLVAGLGELLVKVGLGERLTQALQWAEEQSVTSLSAMLTLLQLQEAHWATLLKALGPTKAYHKQRIKNQLKKMTTTKGAVRSAAELYWTQLETSADDPEDEAAEDEAASPTPRAA